MAATKLCYGEQIVQRVRGNRFPKPSSARGREVDRSAFDAECSGDAIGNQQGFCQQLFAAFDFSWFGPEVIRYRRAFGEVLLASFFVQLLGLSSPIFFQLVVDKVFSGQPTCVYTSVGSVAAPGGGEAG